jgi:hypothetical protein
MSSYIPIASQTLASPASSVTFSSIPSTLGGKNLRDLVLVYNGEGSSFSSFGMRFNGSADTYGVIAASADGGSMTANTTTSLDFAALQRNGTAGVRASCVAHIFDFARTDRHKSYVGRWSASSSTVEMVAGKWGYQTAITSLNVIITSGNFIAGSSFSLYGIEG